MTRQQRRRIELIKNRIQYAPRSEEYRDENEVLKTHFVYLPRVPLLSITKAPRLPFSKYKPHQGKQECARRVRQMAVSQ